MGLIRNYLPISSEPLTGIFNEDGEQIFIDKSTNAFLANPLVNAVRTPLGLGDNQAEMLSADVIDDSRAFTHPLDGNAVATDHAINLPIQINVQMIVAKDSQGVLYDQIKEYKTNKLPCSVKLKSRRYDDMILLTANHRESKDYFNALVFTLRFREERPQYEFVGSVFENAEQSPTKSLGRKLLEVVF